MVLPTDEDESRYSVRGWHAEDLARPHSMKMEILTLGAVKLDHELWGRTHSRVHMDLDRARRLP
jgi:hypothetical protein